MRSECKPSIVDGNVALAFGLVAAAGLSTTIGAAAAFVMPYSNSSKNLFLAASLALAAGVMLYVSFIEIFATKAITTFDACLDKRYVVFLPSPLLNFCAAILRVSYTCFRMYL